MTAPAPEVSQAVTGVVFEEALLLDQQRWDDWLALYATDAQFWLPTWTADHTLARSPDTELSLIHISARAGLEDRVWRIRSGQSAASHPLPRTTHLVANCVVSQVPASDELSVEASFACHVYALKDGSSHTFHGAYRHRLRLDAGRWLIARKTVILRNDTIPTLLDFYCV